MAKTKYELFAGLSGGFGGAQSYGIYECANAQEADKMAYDLAVEEYESYGGCHGLDDEETIREDLANSFYDGDTSQVSDDELRDAYVEQIESWIEWRAVPVD